MADHRTTLTIYFCGSGNNLAPYKVEKFAVPYLVSIADNRVAGFDGPGGNPKNKPEYLLDDDGLIKVDGWGAKVYQGKTKIKGNINSKTGKGANANIKKALDVIMAQLFSPTAAAVKTINLCGHSRGSVTAIAVAWAINKLVLPHVPDLKVNMFLYDPVAGIKNEFKPRYTYQGNAFAVNYTKLPRVVDDFVGLFQTNLSGFTHNNGFSSSMPSRGAMTGAYTVYAMPGGHNGACKYNMSNEGSNIGRIGLHMAHKFLKAHGSRFTEDPGLSPKEVIEAYAMARNPERTKIKRKSDGTFYDGNNQQAVASSRRYGLGRIQEINGLSSHPFFVNKHHHDTFAEFFPIMANFIRLSNKLSNEDLTRLALTGYRETVATLTATGIAMSN